MADYYSVLIRAIGGLPDNTGDARRNVYERARGALVKQLEAITPPLGSSEITRQRLQLEEQIRRAEKEATAVALFGTEEQHIDKKDENKVTDENPGQSLTADDVQEDADEAIVVSNESELTEDEKVVRRAGPDVLKSAVRDARELGGATSESVKNAREYRDIMGKNGESGDRIEPAPLMAKSIEETVHSTPQVSVASDQLPSDKIATGSSFGVSAQDPEYHSDGKAQKHTRSNLPRRPGMGGASAIVIMLVVVTLGAVGYFAWEARPILMSLYEEIMTPDEPDVQGNSDRVPSETNSPSQAQTDVAPVASQTSETTNQNRGSATEVQGNGFKIEEATPPVRTIRVVTPGSSNSAPQDTKIVEPVNTGSESSLVSGSQDLSAVEDEPQSIQPAAVLEPIIDVNSQPVALVEPKVQTQTLDSSPSEIVPAVPSSKAVITTAGQNEAGPVAEVNQPATPSEPVVLVMLYEEGDQTGSPGKSSKGSVSWRVEETDGLPRLLGTIEVPERGLLLKLSIEKNSRVELPATHIIRATFSTSEGQEYGGVKELSGMALKAGERTQGQPLIGYGATITEGDFLIALEQEENKLKHNLRLMSERTWVDLMIRYKNNKRAVLTFHLSQEGVPTLSELVQRWSE
ncbi:MAG: hypothetical protein COB90_06700 [Hyphomicrobiales bacterium]|nr:MAG: hypothetical protein COB90_06700 [Hyphomicrobiales bacterium]